MPKNLSKADLENRSEDALQYDDKSSYELEQSINESSRCSPEISFTHTQLKR